MKQPKMVLVLQNEQSHRGNPIQTLKLVLSLLLLIGYIANYVHAFSHKEKNQPCLHQENLFFCSQIHKTNYSTCATSLLSTVLPPISTKKLHLKTVISRTSHPQCARVTCSLFSELEMIFAIKN